MTYFLPRLSSGEDSVHSKKFGIVGGDFPMSATLPLPKPVTQKTPSASTGRRRQKKKARFGGVGGYWANLIRRFGTVSSPSLSSSDIRASSADHQSHNGHIVGDEVLGDPDRVDRIVVDRTWSRSQRSIHGDDDQQSPETKSSYGAIQPVTPFQPGWQPSGFMHRIAPPVFWSIWAVIVHFFQPVFPDEKAERNYRREYWSYSKPLARWAAFWLIISWVLGCVFATRPRVLMDDIFLYGVASAFTSPVLIMVAFDWPRDHSIPYQLFVGFSLWMWAIYYGLSIWLCGFYDKADAHWSCFSKDFVGMFYYTTALQVVGLYGLNMQRLPAAVGSLSFFILMCVTVVPHQPKFVRTMINFFLFNAFIIYAHYMKEISERRLYTLRNQLKIQFKATQRAQINERNASDSKRRLTSYVFHEVRVPLNSALLAVQNINSSGIITKDHEIEFHALSGSLNMMRNVLNDVLDFNRMDSGTFEVSSRPFAFHTTMRSLFVPLQLATDSRGQEFVAHLDPNIDRVARRAAYQAMGESPAAISQHMKEHPEVSGVVTGDHVRLRQIVTNLASNATKFTPAGGRITISTKLIHPTPEEIAYSEGPSTPAAEIADPQTNGPGSSPVSKRGHGHALSVSHLSQHNLANGIDPSPELKTIVVRIEVTDTGYGITRRDMDDCNLFSAFNQTEQGKQQGGKGTGLGLALVRQIVKLSGGRLGVRSKAGEGSCFWIELPLGVGREAPRKLNPPSERSTSAIHNIMEQGGRVELGLPKSSDSLNSGSIGSYTPSPLGSPSPPPQRPPLGEEASTSTIGAGTPTRPNVTQRPTYLPMPSPKRFVRDAYPTNSTNSGVSMNSNGSSPLMLFDSNFQGIPTSNSNSSLVFDSGMNVLVVDDDLVTRKLMQRMLVRLGCIVETAENGQAALLALGAVATPASEHTTGTTGSSNVGPILERPDPPNDERFDVIFLDNQMPLLSGINTVAKLREWGRGDFVVGVTGNALLEDQEEYIAAGVDHVLTKPVNEQALRRMLVLADTRRKSKAAARAS
ncbi:Histidine kinase [Mycena venus]|uniref:histidine kinase n=1 Tax=Mycena venus TaxID=2733690 RepID=A0A8H7CZX5_9AGAR|nr:Histidine kinase [Mycena venus]